MIRHRLATYATATAWSGLTLAVAALSKLPERTAAGWSA